MNGCSKHIYFWFDISNHTHLKTAINITESSLTVLPKFVVLATLQTTATLSGFLQKFIFSFGEKKKKTQTTETVLLNYLYLIQ